MSLHKTLPLLAILAGTVSLSGCIIPAGNDNSYGSSGGGNPHQQHQSGSSDYDRGCADAKGGSYDRSGHASRAYEDGWSACKAGGGQSGAQSQGGLDAAKRACLFQLGGNSHVQQVTPLKPGFWEIIVTDNFGRKVACTADAQGNVSDWVNM
jgi:hypothetical protein